MIFLFLGKPNFSLTRPASRTHFCWFNDVTVGNAAVGNNDTKVICSGKGSSNFQVNPGPDNLEVILLNSSGKWCSASKIFAFLNKQDPPPGPPNQFHKYNCFFRIL
jgi:hypothetical protein